MHSFLLQQFFNMITVAVLLSRGLKSLMFRPHNQHAASVFLKVLVSVLFSEHLQKEDMSEVVKCEAESS